MPVNRCSPAEVGDGVVGSVTYHLLLKEYDAKEVFWTGEAQVPCQSTVLCQFKGSDLERPISQVLSTYVPDRILKSADGEKHLMVADTKKRVGLGDQLQVLFKDEQTVTTLYVHFGSVFHPEGFKKNEKDFERGLANLKKAFKIPGFMHSKHGMKLKKLMVRIEKQYQTATPNAHEIQQNLSILNRLVRKGIKEHREKTATTKSSYCAFFAYATLIVLALYYLYSQ